MTNDDNWKEARIEPTYPLVPGEWEITFERQEGLSLGSKTRVVTYQLPTLTHLGKMEVDGHKIIRARRRLL